MELGANCEELWSGLRRHACPHVFAEFHALTWYRLHGYCAGILHDPDTVEDVLQSVYVRLWTVISLSRVEVKSQENAQPAEVNSGEPSADFRQSASEALLHFANLEIDRTRKAFHRDIDRHVQLELAYDLVDPRLPAYEKLFFQESSKVLNTILNNLPAVDSALFTLSVFEGLSDRELARRFHVDRRVVRKRIRQVAEQVRNAM